jgi:hypothetical protein
VAIVLSDMMVMDTLVAYVGYSSFSSPSSSLLSFSPPVRTPSSLSHYTLQLNAETASVSLNIWKIASVTIGMVTDYAMRH